MDSKFYVSYEAARLLKEKGYNEECKYIIYDDGEMFDYQYLKNQDLPEWKWSCPTKAEAIDWLESKGVYISIYYKIDRYHYNVEYKKEHFRIEVCGSRETRLEAEEAVIIKALELL